MKSARSFFYLSPRKSFRIVQIERQIMTISDRSSSSEKHRWDQFPCDTALFLLQPWAQHLKESQWIEYESTETSRPFSYCSCQSGVAVFYCVLSFVCLCIYLLFSEDLIALFFSRLIVFWQVNVFFCEHHSHKPFARWVNTVAAVDWLWFEYIWIVTSKLLPRRHLLTIVHQRCRWQLTSLTGSVHPQHCCRIRVRLRLIAQLLFR